MKEEKTPPTRRDDLSSEAGASTSWEARYRRLATDFDRHRRRAEEERLAAERRAQGESLRDWLEVVDSIERALKSVPEGAQGPLIDGLAAIQRQVDQTLARRGVERLETDGVVFDPRRHEAIAVLPSPWRASGEVMHTERSGYVSADGEVIRPASVVVAS